MDHLRGAARGADRVVAALQQGHRVAARGGVEGDPGAGDPAADHDDLEALPGDRLDRLGARDHQAAGRVIRISRFARGAKIQMHPARSALTVELRHLVDGRALRRCFLLARRAEVEEADEALVVAEADGAPPRLPAQQLGRAPVAGEAAGVGGEQDDVGGDRGRVQVLLVLDRVAAEHGGDDDQGRRAVELRRALGAGRLLQARQRLRADDAEAPGRGQVVVRRPARQLEQLLELLAVERLGPEGLVGAAGADRRLDIHPLTESRSSPAEAPTEEQHAAEGEGAGADADPDRGQRMRARGRFLRFEFRQRRGFRRRALARARRDRDRRPRGRGRWGQRRRPAGARA